MIRSKTESYVGFALRAGKCRCGVGAVASLKSAKVMIVCGTAAENTRKEAVKLAAKLRCPLLIAEGVTVESLTGRANCKLLAITDGSLAKAILANAAADNLGKFDLEAR